MNTLLLTFVCVCVLARIRLGVSLCTFPPVLRGDWTFNRKGKLSFGDSTMNGYVTPGCPSCATSFTCLQKDGTRYLLQSSQFQLENVPSSVYICWDIQEVNTTFIRLYQTSNQWSPPVSDYIVIQSTVPSLASVCHITPPYPAARYSLLIKTDSLTTGFICPETLLGKFTEEPGGCETKLDVCTNNAMVFVTQTTCSPKPFYSAGGKVNCLPSVTSGSTTYVLVYNQDQTVDNTNTYSFTCIATQTNGEKQSISETPVECQPPAETPPKPTRSYTFKPDIRCPITTTPPPTTTTPATSAAVSSTTTTTTTTTTESPLLSTTSIIILVIGILVAIIVILLIIICCLVFRRRKRREEIRKRQETEAEEEALQRRREGARRHSGSLDNSSTDSGYDGRPKGGLFYDKYGEEEETRAIERRHRQDRQKRDKTQKRRVYGPDGELLYEEDIPGEYSEREGGSDDGERGHSQVDGTGEKKMKRKIKTYTRDRVLEDGTVIQEQVDTEYWETDSDGEPVSKEKKMKKKTRTYTRDRILDNGTVIQEQVESEYWETDSDSSADSWQDDPVRSQIYFAKIRRQEMRQVVLDTDPVSQIKNLTTRKITERQNQPERRHRNRKGMMKSLVKMKKKKEATEGTDSDDDLATDRGHRDHTQYLQQYRDKKQMEKKLDDEGFWEDQKSENTAKEIFMLEEQEAVLDGENIEPDQKQELGSKTETPINSDNTDCSGDVLDNSNKRDSTISVNDTKNGSEYDNFPTTHLEMSPRVDVSSITTSVALSTHSSIMKSTGDEDKGGPLNKQMQSSKEAGDFKTKSNEAKKKSKDKSRVTSAIRRLLTERLFGEDPNDDNMNQKSALRKTDGPIKGKVIFVEEFRQGQGDPHNNSGTNLAPLKTPRSPRTVPQRYGGKSVPLDPEQASIFRDGLIKDRNYLSRSGVHNKHHAWVDNGTNDSEGHLRSLGESPEPLFVKRNPHPQALGKKEIDGPAWLRFLHHTLYEKPSGSQTHRESRLTWGSGQKDVMTMDDWRLKRLLEELYKDKKYMDTIANNELSEEEVKELAEYGREYLLKMALYWEEKGPLPPRPSTTALGFRLDKENAAKNAGGQASNSNGQPPLKRNKTAL